MEALAVQPQQYSFTFGNSTSPSPFVNVSMDDNQIIFDPLHNIARAGFSLKIMVLPNDDGTVDFGGYITSLKDRRQEFDFQSKSLDGLINLIKQWKRERQPGS